MNTYSRLVVSAASPLKDALVPSLFVLLSVLQVLDLHSTLTASASQIETNRFIVWASSWVGLAVAVTAVKLGSALLVAGMWLAWKRSRGLFRVEFAACLAVACVAYGFVVTNNYLH